MRMNVPSKDHVIRRAPTRTVRLAVIASKAIGKTANDVMPLTVRSIQFYYSSFDGGLLFGIQRRLLTYFLLLFIFLVARILQNRKVNCRRYCWSHRSMSDTSISMELQSTELVAMPLSRRR
jgi:hypothetical protein